MQNNNDWTGNNKTVFTTLGASNHSAFDREPNDFYATEPKAVELLLEKEKFCKNIWEPACGQGHISEVLKRHGFTVYSSDLVNRGYGIGGKDFLLLGSLLDMDKCLLGGGVFDIITNPPYRYAQAFVEKGISLLKPGHKLALFLRLQFLEGQARKKLFQTSPLKVVYVASKRLNCARNGDFKTFKSNGAICYAWFIWEIGYQGEPVIRWIN